MRQFKDDKRTPGRSLYLLSRTKDYSIVGHVFSQLFPEDYDRVGVGQSRVVSAVWFCLVFSSASRPGIC